MKIYVVTKGDYSDYHIITATTDYEQAKKIAENFSDEWDKAEVEVFENAEIYTKPCWDVRFNKFGEVEEVKRNSSEYSYERANALFHDGTMCVTADAADAAVKIASEKYAQIKAKEAGIV